MPFSHLHVITPNLEQLHFRVQWSSVLTDHMSITYKYKCKCNSELTEQQCIFMLNMAWMTWVWVIFAAYGQLDIVTGALCFDCLFVCFTESCWNSLPSQDCHPPCINCPFNVRIYFFDLSNSILMHSTCVGQVFLESRTVSRLISFHIMKKSRLILTVHCLFLMCFILCLV